MFEVGFSELVMVGLVALLVIGPERLPKTARTAGLIVRRFNFLIQSLKTDLQREFQAEELRQLLEKQSSENSIQAKQPDESGNVPSSTKD